MINFIYAFNGSFSNLQRYPLFAIWQKKYLCLTYIKNTRMKRTILLTAAILCAAGTRAQEAYDLLIPEPETPVALRPVEGGRIYRTEVIPYDKRHDADARNLAGADAYMAYTPEPFAASGDAVAVGQVVEIPYVWTDGVVYLHLET